MRGKVPPNVAPGCDGDVQSARPDLPPQRLVVVSNRLPLVLEPCGDGGWTTATATGGLVTALTPVLERQGGLWIGWPGGEVPEEELGPILARASRRIGYSLAPVPLTGQERAGFYHGFANEVLWPLFHDLHTLCNFDPAYWQSYLDANARFATVTAGRVRPGDFVWVHDYHLVDVARHLRTAGTPVTLGFFLHIPFPAPDIYMNLPWRRQLVESLLQYDLVGFQTARDQNNFLASLHETCPEVRVMPHAQGGFVARTSSRRVRLGHYPISIDYAQFHARAASAEVTAMAAQLQALLPDRQLILGIDRLDYTKGIPHRLEAFALALERNPELHERVTLIQVVVPSREVIPRYHDLKRRIDRLVGRINGRFTRPGGWVPIHYVFRSLTEEELLAYYRAAQIALVTPLKDGMNLVAKEYCACTGDDGVLILSEFAGAAMELGAHALMVNPYDVEGVAGAIRAAVEMPLAERRRRMGLLRQTIRKNDVFAWVDGYLSTAGGGCVAAHPAGAGRAAGG